MKNNIKTAVIIGALSVPFFSLNAQWELVEDFEGNLDSWYFSDPNQNCESFEPNFCDGVREIITDPVSGSGNVGRFKAAKDNVTVNWTAVNAVALPRTVSDGSTFTVYARFAVSDFRMDTVFGTMSVPAPEVTNAYDKYETIVRINTNTAGLLEIRDFDQYVIVSAQPVENLTWYEIWLVHDNDKLSYDVWIRGGDEFPDATLVFDDAFYRYQVGMVDSFVILQSTGPNTLPFGNSGLLLDDIYVDYSGENLDPPLPPSETWAGYPVSSAGDADTEGFIGWINVLQDPWIWSYSLSGWMYLPEGNVSESGGWAYVPN